MEFYRDKIPIDDLLAMRPEVLATWPTGADASDLEASFAYQRDIAEAKRFSRALEAADAARVTLVQPRAGVSLVDDQIKLLQYLETEGEADLLPTTIDSYTRQNRYQDAQNGMEESLHSGRSLLNGFPAANHGVHVCRQVTEAVRRPIQVRHGTPDARLLCEITLAGGFTAFEGGGISYNIPYAKNLPLEVSLAYWQYVDRLTGLYAENGVVINREPFGPLTGTLVPPCISSAVAILEALLAAQQGVTSLTVGYGQCGNLYQDAAAILALRELADEYLRRMGFADVHLTTVFHQWMGGFPPDEAKAFGVIAWGAAAGAMARATKMITKSPHEALGIPTAQANVAGMKASRQIINMIQGQQPPVGPQVDEEVDLIRRETRALVDSTLNLGEGNIALGVVRAFEAGVLDIPFAPSRVAHGAVVPVRDGNAAVRLLEFGHLPLPEDIKEHHRRLIAERAAAEQRDVSFQMVTDDIYAVSKGRLVGHRKQ